jgi:hypothetical protein
MFFYEKQRIFYPDDLSQRHIYKRSTGQVLLKFSPKIKETLAQGQLTRNFHQNRIEPRNAFKEKKEFLFLF